MTPIRHRQIFANILADRTQTGVLLSVGIAQISLHARLSLSF